MAVELRLGEIRAGQLQDLVGAAQLLDLALQVLDALGLGGADTRSATGINLRLLDPFQQRLRYAAKLRCDRLARRPQRRVLPAVLLHQPHGPLTDLR